MQRVRWISGQDNDDVGHEFKCTAFFQFPSCKFASESVRALKSAVMNGCSGADATSLIIQEAISSSASWTDFRRYSKKWKLAMMQRMAHVRDDKLIAFPKFVRYQLMFQRVTGILDTNFVKEVNKSFFSIQNVCRFIKAFDKRVKLWKLSLKRALKSFKKL